MVQAGGALTREDLVNQRPRLRGFRSPILIHYVTAASPPREQPPDSFAQSVEDRALRSYYGGTAVGEAVVDADAVSGAPSEAHYSGEASALVYGNLEIRTDEIQALVDGHRVGLTVREFQVLSVLVQREDRVVRRGDIYGLVWGGEMKHRDRSVDVFVRKVRNKLAHAAPDWAYIHTHFGVGYRFAATPPRRPFG
jgi:Transcriptional regulatory protein, C terminal